MIPDNDFTRENSRKARERYLSAVSDIVSGGLWVDDDPNTGCGPAEALCRVAGSLLKAATIARFSNTDGELNVDGETGWGASSFELTDVELYQALTWISAVLRGAPVILDHLRANDDFRSSYQQADQTREFHRRRVRIAGEAAVAEQDAAIAAKAAESTPAPEPSEPKAKRRPKARARRASR